MINIICIILAYMLLSATPVWWIFWIALFVDAGYWYWKYQNAKKLQKRMENLGVELANNIQEHVKTSVYKEISDIARSGDKLH